MLENALCLPEAAQTAANCQHCETRLWLERPTKLVCGCGSGERS